MDWWQEILSTIDLSQIAPVGVVGVVIVLILRGWLSPRTVTEDLRSERDAWKNAYLESEKARGVLMGQNGELLEAVQTTNHILRSLGGDPNVAKAPRPARN